MDVIALHRLGYEAAVATCGTALTVQHMKTLKKYTDRIILLFDQDKAGIEATKRALSLAYTQDLYPLVMTIPETYKDVDELAQAIDTNQVTTPDLMASIQDGLQHILHHLQQRIDTHSPIDKKRLLNELFGLVAMVSSLSIQQHYLTLIAEQLRMNESIIIVEFQVFFADQKRRLQQQARRTDTA
jgi:DNA primase